MARGLALRLAAEEHGPVLFDGLGDVPDAMPPGHSLGIPSLRATLQFTGGGRGSDWLGPDWLGLNSRQVWSVSKKSTKMQVSGKLLLDLPGMYTYFAGKDLQNFHLTPGNESYYILYYATQCIFLDNHAVPSTKKKIRAKECLAQLYRNFRK